MYVYRFLDKYNQIIYIGKTTSLKNRISNHIHLPLDCYNEIFKIEYITLKNSDEMSIYERYLINKHTPKYNIEYNNNSEFCFELPEKKWSIYNGKIKINHKIKSDVVDINTKIKNERLRYFEFCFNNLFIITDMCSFISDFFKKIDINKTEVYICNGYPDEEFEYKINGFKVLIYEPSYIIFKKRKKEILFEVNDSNILYFENNVFNGISLIIGKENHTHIRIDVKNLIIAQLFLEYIKECGNYYMFNFESYKVDGESLYYDYMSDMSDYLKFIKL